MSDDLTRVQRRQKQTRERIFRQAMELFKQKGFDHTTVAEISAAADVGKGTFFTYFPSKDAIFGYLGEMMVESMSAALEEAVAQGRPTFQALQALFQSAAAWHENNSHLTQQFLLSALSSQTAIAADRPNQLRLLDILTDCVRRGQERREFRPDLQPEDAAVALLGAYFSVLLVWGIERSPRSLSECMTATLDVVFQGLLV